MWPEIKTTSSKKMLFLGKSFFGLIYIFDYHQYWCQLIEMID